jgi:hypothetical protein
MTRIAADASVSLYGSVSGPILGPDNEAPMRLRRLGTRHDDSFAAATRECA